MGTSRLSAQTRRLQANQYLYQWRGPGSSCFIDVTFTPTTKTPITGTLTLVDSGGNSKSAV
jgi:hypothetical protein